MTRANPVPASLSGLASSGLRHKPGLLRVGSTPRREGGGSIHLEQNLPNPAPSSTVIRFSLPAAAIVSLVVVDVSGRVVERVLDEAPRGAGEHQITLDTRTLRNGLYFYRLRAGEAQDTRKMVVSR
jgi:hypothetical protein